MSFLIDQLAERLIRDAIKNGQMDDLPGKGKPLEFEDDALIPNELKMEYHVLKNAGYLPPELIQRKEALDLCHLIAQLNADERDHQEVTAARHKLNQLELKLRIKGIDTQFLHRYLQQRSIEKF